MYTKEQILMMTSKEVDEALLLAGFSYKEVLFMSIKEAENHLYKVGRGE